MKLVVIAGTPGSGKTSVLMHAARCLEGSGSRPAVVKVDCLWTEDDKRIGRLGIPVHVALSRDMCPDHFSIYNVDEMLEWAKKQDADVLLNETAGLCLRCAPYPDHCLAVCVIDVTTGPNTPLKVGPLLTTADVVVTTKGDLVSQAEREVFRERVLEANPHCRIVEANGLTGKGGSDLAEIIRALPPAAENMMLRHNPPLAVCTLCSGELRVSKRYHRGVLRHMDGFMEYSGE
ncbi:MAG TPA: GTP-binding protein [Methanotrichaceae archaeon]|nr:GTP-binding protein [Methanotrichaceae archaeon]HQJ29456.1 GTP-binding protein [Methanotrichaceae archaeon]